MPRIVSVKIFHQIPDNVDPDPNASFTDHKCISGCRKLNPLSHNDDF